MLKKCEHPDLQHLSHFTCAFIINAVLYVQFTHEILYDYKKPHNYKHLVAYTILNSVLKTKVKDYKKTTHHNQ